jgi:hypothetical protein
MCLLLLPPSYLLQLLGLRPSVRSISGIYTCSLPLLKELSCSEVVSSYLRFYKADLDREGQTTLIAEVQWPLTLVRVPDRGKNI